MKKNIEIELSTVFIKEWLIYKRIESIDRCIYELVETQNI